jgi:hypothetical protein
MSIFSGASKGEKKQESDTFGNLNNLFSSTYSSGVGLGEKGSDALDTAAGFQKRLVSGDRTAIAPAANAAVGAADAAKREQAQMGTSRGGGVAGQNQEIESHTRELISSLLGEEQSGAADKLGALGEGELGQSMNALGIASGTESNLSSLLHRDVSEKNASAAKIWGSLVSGGMNLLTGGLSGGLSGLFGKSAPAPAPGGDMGGWTGA